MPWDLINRMVPIALDSLQDLIDGGVLDRRELENDPLAELEAWDDITVQRLPSALVVTPSSTLGKECSVAGTYYDPTSTARAVIAVAESGSTGRDAFTALHELGHHIQRTTAEIADVLADLPSTSPLPLKTASANGSPLPSSSPARLRPPSSAPEPPPPATSSPSPITLPHPAKRSASGRATTSPSLAWSCSSTTKTSSRSHPRKVLHPRGEARTKPTQRS